MMTSHVQPHLITCLDHFSIISRLTIQRRNIELVLRKKPVVSSQVLIWWETPSQTWVLVIFTFLMSPGPAPPTALAWISKLASFWRWRWWGWWPAWTDYIYFCFKIWRREATAGVWCGPFLHAILPLRPRQLLALGNVKIETLGWGSGSSCPPPVHLSTLDNNSADYLLVVSKLHRTLTKKPQDLPCQDNRHPASQPPPVNFPPTLFPSQFFVSQVPV